MPQAWWYVKHRRNPTGVLGRPRSSVPVAARRKQARLTYQANLASRGLCSVRLVLDTPAAVKLKAIADACNRSPGAVVSELLERTPDPPRGLF